MKFMSDHRGAFYYASDQLKINKAFVRDMIRVSEPFYFLYTHEKLRNDKQFICELVEEFGFEIIKVSDPFIRDKVYSHVKQPTIEFLKNELKKEGKLWKQLRLEEKILEVMDND